MGDACEMLIAAELTLAGIPALKVPDNWPHYDVIAQPPGASVPLRVSVKSRTYKKGAVYISYMNSSSFDWLALVLLGCSGDRPRRIFLIPRSIADVEARRDSPTAKTFDERYWRVDEVPRLYGLFEDNFALKVVSR